MATIMEVIMFIINPLFFLCISASFIPRTIYKLIATRQFSVFLSPNRFKSAWFANFWAVVGPETRKMAANRVGPLIEQAQGVVLDIGPGSGEWLHRFDSSKIEMIYGVEPSVNQHVLLKQRIKEAGLEGKYIIVPVGVEDLGERWVKKGEVDTVVTIQCLCSVPEPKRMIGDLYGYLKDGGYWVVYEHVKVSPECGTAASLYQSLIDIVWPQFHGGCSITRDSGGWLKQGRSWSKVDLKQPEDEPGLHILPHVMGILTK